MINLRSVRIALLASTCASLTPVAAFAQTASTSSPTPADSSGTPAPQASSSNPTGDIIVTARKRSEASLTVPVVLTAVDSSEISRRSIVNVEGLARVVPQLVISPQGSIQGGTITLRGISGSGNNVFADQAVAFNIDGLQVAKSAVARMSDTDISQVEVLKGPQALFYGKNSPGGIITIRTADPTTTFQAKLSGGYEFYAHEKRFEGAVSGPITDNFGFRISGYYSDSRGDVKNNIPDSSYMKSTALPYLNGGKDAATRLTLKWDPSDQFSARFKFGYAHTADGGMFGQSQKINCTFAQPQSGAIDDCRPNDEAATGSQGPLVVGHGRYFRNGVAYGDATQYLSSLELTYHPNDSLTLTSLTGLYAYVFETSGNASTDYALVLANADRATDRELSQEFRIQSDYDGPVNFTAGGIISDTRQSVFSNTFLYASQPSAVPLLAAVGFPATALTLNQVSAFELVQDGRSYSGFLQLSYHPIEKVEITAGGRYSSEEKSIPDARSGGRTTTVLDASTIQTLVVSKRKWNDFSPEITASYHPTSKLNFFASYKHGFLSGGFNGNAGSLTAGDISFNQETVAGFEIGSKALLFDNKLRINLAAFDYTIKGLQVNNTVNAVQFIRNAASAKSKGIEADFSYRTPLAGLSLTGSIAYNDAHYTSFPNAPCYNGETPAQGCHFDPVSKGNIQNLSGTRLIQTPILAGNAGFNYDRPITSQLKLGLSTDVSYSGSYFADAFADPRGKEPEYALLDASVRLAKTDDSWELALIGKNLTNVFYWGTAQDVSFTGGGTATAAGIRSDKLAATSRGREIWLRLTVKFGH